MSEIILHIRRSSPRALLALVALALVARLAVPAGWMPARTAYGFALTLCPGKASGQPKQDHSTPGMHHVTGNSPGDKERSDNSLPCAFSGVFAATPASQAGPIVGVALAPVMPTDRRRPATSVGRGLAAPPPPSRAPPSRLA